MSLKSDIEAHFNTQDLGPTRKDPIQRIIELSTHLAVSFYPHAPREAQITVGIFNTYVTAIDDIADELRPDLHNFAFTKAPTSKLLASFTNWLEGKSTRTAFGQFGNDMIRKSVLDFITICYYKLDQEDNIASSYCPAQAPQFAEYIRTKSSLAEAYALFAFPEHIYPEGVCLSRYLPVVPDLMRFICAVNDVLSFPEERKGEKFTFVHIYSRVKGVEPLQALGDICEETVRLMHRIRGVLGEERMRGDIEAFMHGYILLHLGTPRYKLYEMDIPAAKEAARRLGVVLS
ncbi:isoprenoid synthase domain-containing protein [Aspergillus avenaceus]|uniref:Isoprenoid synthase domain-containing protein n=1 Tax=Aspergillus avenaceus TaxID=36643 RepID=A0A5N6TRB3_ASPAV|nr:isoprenoid synthase domain-containing protein [Aspergillus avenaceus]